MSSSVRPSDATPIVVHGPLTGDPDRLRQIQAGGAPAVITQASAPGAATVSWRPAGAVSVAPAERVFGLDAFRGLMILAMNLAFTIPVWGPFPDWMYHAQVPPSRTGAHVPVPGLNWRDMLFPMFLFTMAAALPVVMGRRLAKGQPYPAVIWVALRRAFLLSVFALIIGHVNPYWTGDYTKRGNIIAIWGLVVAFATFVRLPGRWSDAARRWWRRLAWTAVAGTLFVLPLAYDKTFLVTRRDGIIAAVAFCTVAGTLLWLSTRTRPRARALALLALAAGRLLTPHLPWLREMWYARPLPWLYEAWYLDLLILVIAGTFAGDLLVRLSRVSRTDGWRWSGVRLSLTALLGFSPFVILAVGLYHRRHPAATTVAVAVVAAALWLLTRDARAERERALAALFTWGGVLLVAGMLLEPLEGGMKKDPQTLSYLLVMSGAAMTGLGSMLILFDGFQRARARRWLSPLVVVGQNSLFAYVVFMLGIGHLLWLTGLGDRFTGTWQEAAARSVMLTVVAALVVWVATKRRLVWKT